MKLILKLDEVRRQNIKTVDMLIETRIQAIQSYMKAMQITAPLHLPIRMAPLGHKLGWLTDTSASIFTAKTIEQRDRRLQIMLQLLREHGIDESRVADPAVLKVMNAEVKERLPAAERQGIDDATAALMQMWSISKAKAFVLEPDLINAVAEARLAEVDHPLMFPYADVWVEPAEQMTNPLEPPELLIGVSMSRPYMDKEALARDKQAIGRMLTQLPYKLQESVKANLDYMEYHAVFSQLGANGAALSHWEYFPAKSNKGYNSDGVINEQSSAANAPCKPTKLSARLLSYLVSSNVEYELVKRKPPKGAGRRRRQLTSPYYVTRVKKNYTHGISKTTRARTGTGGRYTYRFEVVGHWFHRWYCIECDKMHAIRRFLAEAACVRCGNQLTKMEARIRAFWQIPHERGPDVAEQARRRAYEITDTGIPEEPEEPEEPDDTNAEDA